MIPALENTVAIEPDPIAQLIPQGIEAFRPRCIVCTAPVPAKRATSRSKDTCSPACHKVLRMYRQHVLKSSKCPACYHPSTPEERKEFQAWRKMRGDRRQSVGRPKKTNEDRLRQVLTKAITVFDLISLGVDSETQDLLHRVMDRGEDDQIALKDWMLEICNEAKELIDNPGDSAPTLKGERVEPDEGEYPDGAK